MNFLEKHPKFRLIFTVSYIFFIIGLLIRDFSIWSLIWSIPLIFATYLSLCHARLIKDKIAVKIDPFKFDLLSTIVLLFLLWSFIFSI